METEVGSSTERTREESRGKKLLQELRKSLAELIPSETEISTVEFEGPEIAIYVKNPRAILDKMEVIRELAHRIKKRVVIRTDPSIRKPKDETKRIIYSLVPREAEIKGIEFDDVLGEVIIKAERPGLVIGKGGVMRREIIAVTGWRPVVVRAPPAESKILDSILSQLVEESSYRRSVLRAVGERIHREILFKGGSLRLVALGGFKEVGRSAILVETPESKILLDVGINPGSTQFPDAAPSLDEEEFNLEELDAVIVTHAHLDHSGLVPLLTKYGYNGPIYATKATRDIMALVQLDYLEVTSKEGRLPPYSQREIRRALLHTIPVDYGEVTDIAPDVRMTLYDAGHILGSAMVHLHIGNGLYNIVYTSDFRFANTKLLNRANCVFPRVETLIMESTYGATELPDRTDAEQRFVEAVKRVIERSGKVLVPVMAVGRGQEILLVLHDAIERGLLPRDVPIYVEGMVSEVTALHTHYPELLAPDVRRRIEAGEDPFKSENFIEVSGRGNTREELLEKGPSIIIATSGMLNGGPSVEYFKLLCEDPKNALIFVSYQVQGTLGRKIKDGAREVFFMLPEGRLVSWKVNLEVLSVEGFSGHSDRAELLDFLYRLRPKPKMIVLNHGEPAAISALASSLQRNRYKLGLHQTQILAPNNGEVIRLL
ncbi:MAG: beta-CASP ribonuclease aCPSF1 [Fervidicoccaceae archaeon]